MKATDLETMISLRQFRNTSSLEKRFLYSQGITKYSTYRSTSHFSSNKDDPSTLPPVIFPLSLTTDTLASLPMLVLNDSYTMVQPTVKLARLGGGEYCVECVIRLTGAVAGLPDLSVFRQADYFRHVTDIQARVELHYCTARGWQRQEQDLTQGGIIRFQEMQVNLVQEIFQKSLVFRGCLVIRQFAPLNNRVINTDLGNSFDKNSGLINNESSESEPEGEDLGHDDDEDEESEEDGEDLGDFIQDDDEVEFSGEEEEAPEIDGQNGQDHDEEESDEASDENEETQFSSEDEVIRKPRYQNGKKKTRRKLSSDDEEPRSKKRRILVVDSDSDEEEVSRAESKSEKDDLDSGSEESKYETDSELGDDDAKEPNDPRTPEACFSDEDSIVTSVEKDILRERGKTMEAMFSSDDEEGENGQSLSKDIADGGDVPDDVNKVAEDNKVQVSVNRDSIAKTEASVNENAIKQFEENISTACMEEQLSCDKSADIVIPQSVLCLYTNNK